MNITLSKLGESEFDITDRFIEKSETTVAQESERATFQRSVDNVKAVFSDIDYYFSNLFKSVPASTIWVLSIYEEGRRIYRGFVNKDSITLKVKGETVAMDSFSITREFIERAKQVKKSFMQAIEGDRDNDYFTLEYVLTWQLSGNGRDDNPFDGLFDGFDLGGYEDRQIRSSHISDDPDIGNETRFINLMSDTTMDELLQAMARYYNAEFFIDPETLKFTMRQRNIVLNDRAVTEGLKLEDVLKEDSEPEIVLYDKDTFDYVKLDLGNIIPPKLEYVSEQALPPGAGIPGIPRQGNILYGMTVEFDNYETVSGPLLDIMFYFSAFPPPVDRAHPDRIYIPVEPLGGRTIIRLNIPAYTEHGGVRRRHIYRNDSTIAGAGNDLRRLAIVEGNNALHYDDNVFNIYIPGDEFAIYYTLPTEQKSFGMWVRYDETTGLWSDPIVSLDEGRAVPRGRIFTVDPKLRFRSAVTPSEQLDSYWGYTRDFFGNESFTQTIREQWKDLFRTKRRVRCAVSGLNYRVGDSMISAGQIVPNDYTPDSRLLIKRAGNQLISEVTQLEMLTI